MGLATTVLVLPRREFRRGGETPRSPLEAPEHVGEGRPGESSTVRWHPELHRREALTLGGRLA